MTALQTFDVIFITETWLGDTSVEHLDGFTSYRRDRAGGGGGGVIIYISNNICSSEFSFANVDCCPADLLATSRRSVVESVWVTIEVGSDRLLLGCIYRPPYASSREHRESADTAIAAFLHAARESVFTGRHDGLLICGDFNYSDIEWSPDGTATADPPSLSSRLFVDCLHENSLAQAVNFATYKHDETSESTLDLVLVDDLARIVDIQQGSPLGDSFRHHYSLTWSLKLSGKRAATFRRTRFNLAKGDTSQSPMLWTRLTGPGSSQMVTSTRTTTCFCSSTMTCVSATFLLHKSDHSHLRRGSIQTSSAWRRANASCGTNSRQLDRGQ